MLVKYRERWAPLLMCVVLGLGLAGCASRNRAPVEDRSASTRLPPGYENAGKPGYYTVKPRDTLVKIGAETGQNWRDIARWNNMETPYPLEVGQVLRVAPPFATPAEPVALSRPIAVPGLPPSSTTPAPLPSTSPGVLPAAGPAGSASGAAAVTPRPSAPAASAPGAAPAASAPVGPPPEDEIAWIWPANGNLLAGFDESRNKGLDIAGAPGDAVLAAADGKVVYAGFGLRGYGNLVILKHNNTYLTAYAHNQALLVKEDQVVRQGQKIAEMGSSDADRVKLHFEIRRQGKPVDPARFLPSR